MLWIMIEKVEFRISIFNTRQKMQAISKPGLNKNSSAQIADDAI